LIFIFSSCIEFFFVVPPLTSMCVYTGRNILEIAAFMIYSNKYTKLTMDFFDK